VVREDRGQCSRRKRGGRRKEEGETVEKGLEKRKKNEK
jgi:hypothetical protein